MREVEAVLRLARLVDGDDVGMLERGLQPALASEARDELRVAAELAGEHLQRHLAAVLDVAGAVDGRHPAATEHPLDAVAPRPLCLAQVPRERVQA